MVYVGDKWQEGMAAGSKGGCPGACVTAVPHIDRAVNTLTCLCSLHCAAPRFLWALGNGRCKSTAWTDHFCL